MTYSHTQEAPLHWLLVGIALVLGVAAIAAWSVPVAGVVLAGSAAILALLALGFQSLTVEDLGEHLELRYGPLPIFRKRIAYETITAFRQSRSTLVDGFGIHWVPGRGWTYNLWGFDCVELDLGRRTLRIGTDDPEGLVAFLEKRVPPRVDPE